jgi:hypothetical protein
MPRKAVGRQPLQKGPAWDAFVAYWKRAIDGKQSRACAWRAFHAGWVAQPAAPPASPLTGSLPTCERSVVEGPNRASPDASLKNPGAATRDLKKGRQHRHRSVISSATSP